MVKALASSPRNRTEYSVRLRLWDDERPSTRAVPDSRSRFALAVAPAIGHSARHEERPRVSGVWHTIGGRSLLRRDEYTMADRFAVAGYRTSVAGAG